MKPVVQSKRLGDLFTFQNGRAFKKAEWTTSGLPIIRIQNLNREDARFNYFAGEYAEEILVESGDLLFSWSGTVGSSFGPHIWSREKGVLNQHIFAVGLADAISKRYAFHGLRHITEEIERSVSGAVGLVHITKKKLNEFTLPVPPLPEQQRIVGILDEAFEGIATAKANAEKNLQNARALFESHLESVFSQCGDGLVEKPLAELCETGKSITYGVIKLGEEVLDGTPCLRTSNVRWLRVETERMKRIAPGLSSEYSRTILKGGELLVNVRGTLGGVAVVTPEMAGWNVSREVAVVPVDSARVDPSFLAYLVGSGASQQWLVGVKKGAAYVGINLEDLRRLPVFVPKMEKQREIVRHLESFHGEARRLEAVYQQKTAALGALKESLLHEAFTGQLGAQAA